MSVYDVGRLIAETRKLAVEYRQATGKILPVTSEIAVHDVIRLMDLEGAKQGEVGFDAIGKGSRVGRRIQIKGRTLMSDSKSSQRIGQIKIEQQWDSIMLLLMDDTYEPIEIYEAQRDIILASVKKTSKKRRTRGAMSIAKFKVIGKRVWSREGGLI